MNKISNVRSLWDAPKAQRAFPSDKPPRARPIEGSVFCAVCLPPPLHGQSVVNAAVINAAKIFAGADKVEVVDIGPGRRATGLSYHLTRIYRVAHATWSMIRRGARADQKLYTVFESGFGVAYNIVLVSLARILNYDIVLHHHTSKHTLEWQGRFRLLQRLAGSSCLHIVLSEEMAESMRRIYPGASRILVSQNACHTSDCRVDASPRIQPKKLQIGFLSNLCLEKGLDIVLQTAAMCKERGLDATFAIAGPTSGKEAELILSKGREKLGSYIKILGPVTDDSKAEFFRSIDIFLFPTRYRYEAQPLVLLEAMSYGLPVITTRCGYVAELVGQHGIVLDGGNDLARQIVGEIEKIAGNSEWSQLRSLETKLYFQELRLAAFAQLQELMNALFSVEADRVDAEHDSTGDMSRIA